MLGVFSTVNIPSFTLYLSIKISQSCLSHQIYSMNLKKSYLLQDLRYMTDYPTLPLH